MPFSFARNGRPLIFVKKMCKCFMEILSNFVNTNKLLALLNTTLQKYMFQRQLITMYCLCVTKYPFQWRPVKYCGIVALFDIANY